MKEKKGSRPENILIRIFPNIIKLYMELKPAIYGEKL